MVEAANRHFPGQERHVNNMSSGIFNTFNGIGEVIGPMYGAAMYERIGFRSTSDTIMLICFTYALIFFLFGLSDNVVEPESGTNYSVDYNAKRIVN